MEPVPIVALDYRLLEVAMTRFETRSAFGALTLAALFSASAYTTLPAQAKTNFDGNWSVVIITEEGSCDRSYRYPVRISDGTVGYAGEASFNVSGRVGPNGKVTVTVSRGDRRASGSGMLSANTGAGSWTGGECSGSWEAERRS
jgi:hypothetical protein